MPKPNDYLSHKDAESKIHFSIDIQSRLFLKVYIGIMEDKTFTKWGAPRFSPICNNEQFPLR